MKKNGTSKRARNYRRKVIPRPERAGVCYTTKVCPDVMRARLKYTEQRNLSGSGLSNFNSYVFRGNSIFDPNFSGGGHQPLGHDEWSNFYRRYRVIGAKITVMASSDTAVNMTIGVSALNSSSGPAQGESYQESDYTRTAHMGGDAGNNIAKVELYVPTHKIRGGPPNLVRYEEDYAALFGVNPAKQFFFHIWDLSTDGSTTWDVNHTVTIEYYVEMYDREFLSQS